MAKLAVFRIGSGSFTDGFSVTFQLGDEAARPTIEVIGYLPPDPDLLTALTHWQTAYRQIGSIVRLSRPTEQVTNVDVHQNCQIAADQLRDRLNRWLQADSFRTIRETWLEQLQPSETIRAIVQVEQPQLRQLPWHLWELLDRYINMEFALSTPSYQQVNRPPRASGPVQVLAILGHAGGIDVQADRAVLEQLPDAEVCFLVEPNRQDLSDRLWEKPWDILFFAGHSDSQAPGDRGQLWINPHDGLTTPEVRYALRKAVEQGLQLAIFNSCDGLGLARDLADLQIPTIVVMREPIPDSVAQSFVKYFLESFSSGESLYLAVRHARERLQPLEAQFPCATWLPVICQHPAEMPPLWQHWVDEWREGSPDMVSTHSDVRSRSPRSRHSWRLALCLSGIVFAGVMGIRHIGGLQPLELRAYDHFLHQRPAERPDPRIVVITITEPDIETQPKPDRRGSLSDRTLNQLLRKLETYQPRLIGLDIYRDYPVQATVPDLAKRLRHHDRLIAICRAYDAESNQPSVHPPPEITPDRLGFSDLILDQDTIVRRHLLAMDPPESGCTTPYAFSTQLALRYLNKPLEFTETGNWKIGSVTLPLLQGRSGGYQAIDTRGHQILLNYRAFRTPEDIAIQIPLGQFLSGQIDREVLRDRIVLIGTTAESFRDISLTAFLTPDGKPRRIFGVYMQAQMISQLLSAVLNQRPLLWVWPRWLEALWIGSWALVGGLFVVGLRRWQRLAIAVLGTIAFIYISCLLSFIQIGAWIPLVPAMLSMILTSVSVVLYSLYFGSQSRSRSQPPRRNR